MKFKAHKCLLRALGTIKENLGTRRLAIKLEGTQKQANNR